MTPQLTRLWAVSLLVLLSAMVRPLAAECPGEASPRIAQVRQRWQWEIFWGTGISRRQYAAGRSVSIQWFWRDNQVGFCSFDLGTCALYDSTESSLGQIVASSSPSRRRDLGAVARSFLQTPARPPVVTRIPNSAGQGVNGDARVFAGEGGRITLPEVGEGKGNGQSYREFKFCRDQIALPAIEPPEAISKRTVPDDLQKVTALLRKLLANLPDQARGKTNFFIPFYAPSDPMLFVLVRTSGEPDSIIFLVHGENGSDWKVGGHFDSQFSQSQLDKLVPLILSAKMTSVAATP